MNFTIIKTNGLTERLNQTLVTQISKIVGEDSTDWDVKLQSVVFSYRTNTQSSIKTSPFELMYGVKPRFPAELDLPTIYDIGSTDQDRNGDLLSKRETAVKNIKLAQSFQKRRKRDMILSTLVQYISQGIEFCYKIAELYLGRVISWLPVGKVVKNL